MLYSPGLRPSLLFHQRSTHWFTSSEIATFAEPFAAPSIGYLVLMNTIYQTLVHNQIETEGYKKVELVSVLQVRKQNAEKSVIQKLKL